MKSFDLLIQFDDDSQETAEVYVEGKIQGVACRFLLDTGCARTSLNFDDFSSNFEKVGSNESSGIFCKTHYDEIKVDSLEFGDFIETNVILSRAREGELDRKLLGMDILKKYSLNFSFLNKKVEVNQGLSLKNLIMNELILDKGSIPQIAFKFADSDVLGVWDSGASVTLADINFINKHHSMFEKVGSELGTDSTGKQMETPMYIMKPITLGNQELPAHKVAGVNLSNITSNSEIPMVFVFGYSTLSKANWLFDFPQKKWAIWLNKGVYQTNL